MKLFLILLIMGLFLITGCTEQLLSVEEKEAIGSLEGEEGSLTGQAVNTNTCKTDTDCWSSYLSCYKLECISLSSSERKVCAANCLAEAPGPKSFCENVGECAVDGEGADVSGSIVCEDLKDWTGSTLPSEISILTGDQYCGVQNYDTCLGINHQRFQTTFKSADLTCQDVWDLQDDWYVGSCKEKLEEFNLDCGQRLAGSQDYSLNDKVTGVKCCKLVS
jgi:hypothetical protein